MAVGKRDSVGRTSTWSSPRSSSSERQTGVETFGVILPESWKDVTYSLDPNTTIFERDSPFLHHSSMVCALTQVAGVMQGSRMFWCGTQRNLVPSEDRATTIKILALEGIPDASESRVTTSASPSLDHNRVFITSPTALMWTQVPLSVSLLTTLTTRPF